jgi:hypothetical protein
VAGPELAVRAYRNLTLFVILWYSPRPFSSSRAKTYSKDLSLGGVRVSCDPKTALLTILGILLRE